MQVNLGETIENVIREILSGRVGRMDTDAEMDGSEFHLKVYAVPHYEANLIRIDVRKVEDK